jgi:hypothetical protein
MAYEKQFWEQPHHDSSEEDRLYSLIKMQAKTIELNKETFLKVKQINNELLEALQAVIRLKHLIDYPANTKEKHIGEAMAISGMLHKVEAAISKASEPQ